MAREAGPTLWLGIPIFTLAGITIFRVGAGISHGMLGIEYPPVFAFIVIGLLLSAQLVMGLLGYAVMRGQGYFAEYVWGEGRSVPAYGLICPGVALSVLGMFFIHWGLIATGIVDKFSLVHFVLLAMVFAMQLRTIQTVIALNRKLLYSRRGASALRDETGQKVGLGVEVGVGA